MTHGQLTPDLGTLPAVRLQRFMLLGDRGTFVRTTCLRLLPESGAAGSLTRDL